MRARWAAVGAAMLAVALGPAAVPSAAQPEGEPPPATGAEPFPDLAVEAIEVTQGVQDLASSLPLVAGRRTWVRVHVAAEGGARWGPIDGLLLVERAGRDDLILGPETAPVVTGEPRTEPDGALLFLLPRRSTLAGRVQLTAGVWAREATTLDGEEPDAENNLRTATVTFHEGQRPLVRLAAADLAGVLPRIDLELRERHPVDAVDYAVLPDPLPDGRRSAVAEATGLVDQAALLAGDDVEPPGHTLGHARGLLHVACLDADDDGVADELAHGPVDETHPTASPRCSLAPVAAHGHYGLTTYRPEPRVISNDPEHPSAAFPFMSSAARRWADPYHWCVLMDGYGVACDPVDANVAPAEPPATDPEDGAGGDVVVPPDADRWLLVGGELDPAAATGTLDEVAVRDRVTAAARRQREEHLATVAAGRLAPVGHLLLRREDGHVVGRAPVEWYPADEGAFFQALPWAEDTFAVQLVIGEQVLAERRVSPAPPVVSEVAASVGAGRRVEVTWAASDPDGDPLSALVQWSADGESWLPVLAGVEQGRAVVEPGRGFPGGPEVRVRVEVSDGLRTATATSPPFTAPGHGPVAVVTGLEDGARVDRHDLVELWAQAIDPEEGMLDEELSWRSSRDGVLGQGRILSTRRLSVGEHQIEVFGEDGDGNEARAGLTVTVAPPAEPPRFLEEPDQDGVAFLRGVRTFSGDRTRERAGLYGAMGMLAVAGLGVTTHLFRRAHAGRGGG